MRLLAECCGDDWQRWIAACPEFTPEMGLMLSCRRGLAVHWLLQAAEAEGTEPSKAEALAALVSAAKRTGVPQVWLRSLRRWCLWIPA